MSFKNISKIAAAVAISSTVSAKSFATDATIAFGDPTIDTSITPNFTSAATIKFADSKNQDDSTKYLDDSATDVQLATKNYVDSKFDALPNVVTSDATTAASDTNVYSAAKTDAQITAAVSGKANVTDVVAKSAIVTSAATTAASDTNVYSAAKTDAQITAAVTSKANVELVDSIKTTLNELKNTVQGIAGVKTLENNMSLFIKGTSYTYKKDGDKETLTSANGTVYVKGADGNYKKETSQPTKSVRAANGTDADTISSTDITSANSNVSRSDLDMAKAQVGTEISNLQTQVNSLNSRLNRAIAMAAAMDFVAPNDGKSFNVVVGGAAYRGQSATSLGLTAKYKNVLVGIGGAVSGSDHLVKGVVSISAF